jgi:peptidylprolyl isomerase
MKETKRGDTVKVHYNGTLEDGTVFDSTSGKEPIEFTLGEGEVIPGFEQAVEGMSEGGKRSIALSPEEAFGPYNDELVMEVPRSQLPDHIEPQVGMALQARAQDGSVTRVEVTNVGEDTVTLDGNHPLAGKPVSFDIELVAIV